MKFSIVRKINLSNINKDAFGFETEDIGIHDADSFDEACQTVDKLVAERMGYYRAKAESAASQEPTKRVIKNPSSSPAPADGPVSTPTSATGITSEPPADLA